MAKVKKDCSEILCEITALVKNASGSYDDYKTLEDGLIRLAEFVEKKASDKKAAAYLEVKAKLEALAAELTEEEIQKYEEKLQRNAERSAKIQAARAAKKAEV